MGCSKETASGPGTKERYDPTERIVAFINKARGRTAVQAKSGEVFTTDSAVWYVEAALNFSFGNATKECKVFDRDSLTIPLNSSEGEAQGAAVYAAFNELASIIAPLTTEEQHVALIDVVDPQPGASDLLVVLSIGSGYDKAAPNSVYGPKAYHYFLGPIQHPSCDCQPPPNNPTPVWCANKLIEQRINAANLVVLTGTQYITDVEQWQTWTFTDIPGKKIMPLELELAGPLPYTGGYHASKTYTWLNGASQGATCLTPSEMTFWTGNATQGTWSGITAIKAARCPNKTFLNCWIGGTPLAQFWWSNGTPVTGAWAWHHCVFTYGRIVDGTFGG